MNHKAQRAALMNAIIYEIATTGRRFFYRASNISYLELDARDRVWFVDSYTERRIYTHHPQRWRGFTSGGTMRALVQTMRDFITGAREEATADAVMGHFGPWPDWYNRGDPWGYGADMPSLRERVRVLMKSPEKKRRKPEAGVASAMLEHTGGGRRCEVNKRKIDFIIQTAWRWCEPCSTWSGSRHTTCRKCGGLVRLKVRD